MGRVLRSVGAFNNSTLVERRIIRGVNCSAVPTGMCRSCIEDSWEHSRYGLHKKKNFLKDLKIGKSKTSLA